MIQRPPNSSGYDQALFDRVLRGLKDAVDRVRTILLWRGFLVRREGNSLFLCTGSAEADAQFLQSQGIGVQRITTHEKNYSEILNPNAIPDALLYQVFSCPAEGSVLGGPFRHGGIVNQTWGAFVRCRFGVEVPVCVLDSGIALLVKVLPLLGLHTEESCDGHLVNPPWIRFMSEHHLNWARLVLKPLFSSPEDEFVLGWEFLTEPWTAPRWDLQHDTGLWLLGAGGCGKSVGGRFRLYSAIQRLAVRIMDEEGLAPQIRKAKVQLLYQ
jgi:hypothetical protein